VEEYEKTRAQNVPKTKVEALKTIEIARLENKYFRVENQY